MTTDPNHLLEEVTGFLERSGIPYALIGAAALAVHGISRSTLDIDLLATDARLLEPPFWSSLTGRAAVEVRRGDNSDPLAGVVRCRADGQRDVDIVVGKSAWQAGILSRATPVLRGALKLPTVRAEDLILLKLYAGGSQDRWDIEQLLAQSNRAALIAAVETRLPDLPPDVRPVWDAINSA